eukprot:TRINITY_DN113_c0_g2_i1.p1 TRINITY_DN113_c0_g2~~TRINITY_DN113_c0_g2_i1.p1  ORF type:complete len:429 (+),score=112.02 TRINITY_DN113_c0_g2_i1:226-1512(+)
MASAVDNFDTAFEDEQEMETKKRRKMQKGDVLQSRVQLQFVEHDHGKMPGWLRFRKKTWKLFDDPTSSRGALVLSLTVMFFIFLSTINFVLETLPAFHDDTPLYFYIAEVISIAVFTIEFLVRLASTPDYRKFVKGVLNWIDFLAIVPFYIELLFAGGTGGLAVLRVIRLTRVFRVFKIGKYAQGFMVVLTAISRSLDGLFLLVFFLGLGMVLFSSVLWYAEQTRSTFEDDVNEADDCWDLAEGCVCPYKYKECWVYDEDLFNFVDPDPFQSIPHTLWWAIVTFTTVGYGDTYPSTPAGKATASVAFLCGILILAFPITILGTKFGEAFEENRKSTEYNDFVKEHKHDDLRARAELLHSRTIELGQTLREMEDLMMICRERYDMMLAAVIEASVQGSFPLDSDYIDDSSEIADEFNIGVMDDASSSSV